ncbi:MAG: exodeoxyribonuclease III [Cellvibrionales bacterium TMED49]|nr:MAG: exodeoxyribonuclease III [Cellvibrionales bacterium TMED49]|tara:strand:- start:391 stop:1206 length:816 start_codon:yes stop_codon:yes gene_type:complete
MSKRLVCFNVNGIRARAAQLKYILEKHKPYIIGLQETKVDDESFPIDEINNLGYYSSFFGQKGHYGVALLSKEKPVEVKKGFPSDLEDAQRRFIHGKYAFKEGNLHVLNGYFPQGESRSHPLKFPAKRRFYEDLRSYLNTSFMPSDLLLLMGDMNVAIADADVGLTEENIKRWLRSGKTSFLPEERGWLKNLLAFGLTDTFREQWGPDKRLYSWYDYRSRGFEQNPKRGLRIDLILASSAARSFIIDSGIDVDSRAHEKPSDHCPIWIDMI